MTEEKQEIRIVWYWETSPLKTRYKTFKTKKRADKFRDELIKKGARVIR